MYYSHSPSCPDTALAGSFLYWAPHGEKVGLGCASALINHKSSASFALQAGCLWLFLAFCQEAELDRATRMPQAGDRAPWRWGQWLCHHQGHCRESKGTCQEHRSLRRRRVSPFKCTWLWGRFSLFKGTNPSK